MAESRTSTAKWKRIRAQVLKEALERGLMHCPRCRVGLDWEYSRRPNSPEVDHVIPHAKGGPDAIENTQILCRRCNQQLGGQMNRRKPSPVVEAVELDVSPIW